MLTWVVQRSLWVSLVLTLLSRLLINLSEYLITKRCSDVSKYYKDVNDLDNLICSSFEFQTTLYDFNSFLKLQAVYPLSWPQRNLVAVHTIPLISLWLLNQRNFVMVNVMKNATLRKLTLIQLQTKICCQSLTIQIYIGIKVLSRSMQNIRFNYEQRPNK